MNYQKSLDDTADGQNENAGPSALMEQTNTVPTQAYRASRNLDTKSTSTTSTSLGKRKAVHDAGRSPNRKALKKSSTKSTLETSSSQPHYGDDSNSYIIVNSPKLQKLFDEKRISYGVQWEIARLISLQRLSCDDVSADILDTLKGPNKDIVPKAAKILIHMNDDSTIAPSDPALDRENSVKSPWEELDKEEEALSQDIYAGLGHSTQYPGWYGGKISFRGKLERVGKEYKIALEWCILGPSCRFTRRFGSRSFIRVKIPLNIFHDHNNGLDVFFKRPLILWDRVFRACYAKDQTVFYFRTNERYGGPTLANKSELSFEDFLYWHNPLPLNQNQPMSKYASRFALGFSTSIPGPKIEAENIGSIPDIISTNNSDMTDGCGFSSLSLHISIYHQQSLEAPPTAFQFRLAGSKGMSIRNTETGPLDDKLRISVRPSQTKIKYSKNEPSDPAHCILDLLRTSHLRTPCRISPEIIINLAEAGVPHQIFIDLIKKEMENSVTALTTWDGPDAMFNLWTAVERDGSVLACRAAREAAGEARFRGFRSHDDTVNDNDEDEDDEDGLKGFDSAVDMQSTAWWADPSSGCPSSLWEIVMVLLDSGFTPQECPILKERLEKIVKSRIDSKSEKMRCEILQSASAFVVPDPFGVLGPDEIQIKSSRRNLRSNDGYDTDIILGDVLIARNPCKVPSDIRKVKAVEHHLLREYVDVIVCSVQGLRRLLDFLAGGDYDGDLSYVIWCLEIVAAFTNADDKYSVEPLGMTLGFEREGEQGTEFLKRCHDLSPAMRIHEFQRYLLGGLRDTSVVGKYSNMHDYSIYERGYSHPKTVKLAYKFCKVLDGPKTGWRVKDRTLRSDLEVYHHPRGPEWKSEPKKIDTTNTPFLERQKDSPYIKGRFIMDVLRDAVKDQKRDCLVALDVLFPQVSRVYRDLHLCAPWEEYVEWCETGDMETKKLDLTKIQAHTESSYNEHQDTLRCAGRRSFTGQPIERRQDMIRSLSKSFVASPPLESLYYFSSQSHLNRVRASYAYVYDISSHKSRGNSKRGTRFPWNVAMRELCRIKADAQVGSSKTVATSFYERFRLAKRR